MFMEKKRVIIFTESLYGGGVERILQILCSHFDYSKYDMTIYSVNEETPSTAYYPKDIKFKHVFDKTRTNYPAWKNYWVKIKNKIKLWFYYHSQPSLFHRLFIHEKADVAIAFIEGYATRIVSGFPKDIKKIAWLHIELKNYHWSEIAYRNKEEEKEAYLSMDCIPCVSQEVQKQLTELYPEVTKSIVLHNPVDKDMICRLAKEKLPVQFTKGNTRTLISIGTLNKRKGFHRLLDVTSRLIKEGYNFQLWIVGKGELEGNLKNYIKEHQLSDYASLLGYQENPYNYLAAADIYVCSSFAEGYNTAITEALVLGKAVVSTECSGVKEQLGEENEWGICVPNSTEGLYEGIKKMLEEKTFLHYSRQASIRGEAFTLEESIHKIYSLMD